jgi:hypothetical protein
LRAQGRKPHAALLDNILQPLAAAQGDREACFGGRQAEQLDQPLAEHRWPAVQVGDQDQDRGSLVGGGKRQVGAERSDQQGERPAADLDGCTVDIVEALYGRDEGAWGIFDIAGDVKCDRGAFAYTSSGAWDGNGFHAAGDIEDGSGSGDFEGIKGRVAQLGGGAADAGNGTFDISYDLVFDTDVD